MIDGLSGERERWAQDSEAFNTQRTRLPGDCALASAFLSYFGGFTQQFRSRLLSEVLHDDLKARDIPWSPKLDFAEFFTDQGRLSDWKMQGLPSDGFSVQNGLLVTLSSRPPLLIDPQGQGLRWVLNMENQRRNESAAAAAAAAIAAAERSGPAELSGGADSTKPSDSSTAVVTFTR